MARSKGIAAWVLKKAGPPTVVVEDTTKLKQEEEDAEVVVLGYFEKLEDADGMPEGGQYEYGIALVMEVGQCRVDLEWRLSIHDAIHLTPHATH
eukprot:1159286-Pelagomonas_calceolata.AAC.11